jgi:hypothetical protein
MRRKTDLGEEIRRSSSIFDMSKMGFFPAIRKQSPKEKLNASGFDVTVRR